MCLRIGGLLSKACAWGASISVRPLHAAWPKKGKKKIVPWGSNTMEWLSQIFSTHIHTQPIVALHCLWYITLEVLVLFPRSCRFVWSGPNLPKFLSKSFCLDRFVLQRQGTFVPWTYFLKMWRQFTAFLCSCSSLLYLYSSSSTSPSKIHFMFSLKFPPFPLVRINPPPLISWSVALSVS